MQAKDGVVGLDLLKLEIILQASKQLIHGSLLMRFSLSLSQIFFFISLFFSLLDEHTTHK